MATFMTGNVRPCLVIISLIILMSCADAFLPADRSSNSSLGEIVSKCIVNFSVRDFGCCIYFFFGLFSFNFNCGLVVLYFVLKTSLQAALNCSTSYVFSSVNAQSNDFSISYWSSWYN